MSPHAPSIDRPSFEDTLWLDARRDFVALAPDHVLTGLLPCCACGRLLPREAFNLEHILPQQALAKDPPEVRHNPRLSLNRRSRLILLCKQPLKQGTTIVAGNGCNGWKGKFYDSFLRDLIVATVPPKRGGQINSRHTVALLAAAYLATVSEYGYRVVYPASGMMLRLQFFHPLGYTKIMPHLSRTFMTGGPFEYEGMTEEQWLNPFGFELLPGSCSVRMRQLMINVPMSRDPRIPAPSSLRILPSRYKLRPDFQTMFS